MTRGRRSSQGGTGRGIAGALLVATVGLAGCSSDDDGAGGQPSPQPEASTGSLSEVEAHAGQPCPGDLDAIGDDAPAAAPVSLPSPDSAVVCLYTPSEPSGGGAATWTLSGAAVEVEARDLAVLARQIGDLAPPGDAERFCTDDLGQRWMLVTTVGDDLTGVVVDDFGCTDVRLTDEPFETAPGEATQDGTTAGVLAAPKGLLDRLKLIWVDG